MATKYKIYVNPNNQTQPQANAQIVQQLAQNAAQQQLQQQAEPDEMRNTVNELIKNTLVNPVQMPKYTTIQDIFNAPKGEKLSTFSEFLSNPETMRTIGELMPYYGYDPKTGQGRNVMEAPARREEARFEADRQKALEQLKQQNALAGDVYNAYNQQDIANERNQLQRDLAEQELKWKEQQNALDRELRRQENAENRAQRLELARLIHGGSTGQAAGLTPKQIQKNQEMLNSLNAVQSQMDRFADSFGKVRGRSENALTAKSGALFADLVTKGGWGNEAENNFNAQRTLLFNKIARELGGEKGVLSDQDIKRIEGSLPSLSDTLPQKKAKMKAVYDLLEDRKSQYNIGGNISTNNKDSLGLGI